MQTTSFTDDLHLDTDSPAPNPLRVVIAYDDLAAGKRAMRVMTDLAKAFGDDIEFKPFPWSFDLLADLGWRAVAANDAIKADILIIATSRAGPLPLTIGRWAEDAIHRKRGTAAAVVALFGSEQNPDGAGSSRLIGIQMAARRAGLDFFAPGPGQELNETIARIHQRAEMVTPVLEEILHHH